MDQLGTVLGEMPEPVALLGGLLARVPFGIHLCRADGTSLGV